MFHELPAEVNAQEHPNFRLGFRKNGHRKSFIKQK